MRLQILVGAIVLLALAPQASQAQEQLKLYAVVVNGVSGTPVETLTPDQVKITEDGVEATIVKIEPVNWPVKLQLLVDNGQGLGSSNIQLLKDGILGLLEKLPEGMEVTLVTTSPQPRVLTRATTDHAEIVKGLSLLAPDSGVGRFVESMAEATQRIERDKAEALPVIVSVGTSSGDTNVRDRDIKNIFERLQKLPIIVHVVILQGTASSASGGGNQTQLGLSVTEGTGGRYEGIAVPNRLVTLLPEIGEQVAESHRLASQQFLLTIERPAGKSGDLGQIGAGVAGGLVMKSLSIDGRIR